VRRHFTVRATLAEKERGLQVRCPRCGSAEVAQDFSGVGMAFGTASGPSCCGRGEDLLMRTALWIFTAPDVACGGATWSDAVAMVCARLHRRFGGALEVEHVTLFSPRSFEFPEVMEAISRGAELPLVLLGDRIVSQGGKLSEPSIARAVEEAGVSTERGGRDANG
jgi:hypothetical protein